MTTTVTVKSSSDPVVIEILSPPAQYEGAVSITSVIGMPSHSSYEFNLWGEMVAKIHENPISKE